MAVCRLVVDVEKAEGRKRADLGGVPQDPCLSRAHQEREVDATGSRDGRGQRKDADQGQSFWNTYCLFIEINTAVFCFVFCGEESWICNE